MRNADSEYHRMTIVQRRAIRLIGGFAVLLAWLAWDLSRAGYDPGYGFISSVPLSSFVHRSTTPATVAIVRSNDAALANPAAVTDSGITYATIEQMVRRAVELAGGFQGYIQSGNMVLIKPNLVDIEPSGCGEITDVRVVKALVKIIDEIDHGNVTIVVGEGSPRPCTPFEKATGTTQKAWTQLFDVPGYQALKTEMLAAGVNFRLSNLNGNSDSDPWPELRLVDVPGGGQAQPQGGRYYVHQDVVNADVFITVPVMKIHDPGITVGMKNQIGIAASTRYGFNKMTGVVQEGRIHKLDHLVKSPYAWTDKEIVDLCAIAMAKKTFVLVDAVACLESQKDAVRDLNGKITNLVRMNSVIAGKDPVAVDHICTRLMGLNPDDIEHLTLGEKIGLGTNDPQKITVVGTNLESTARRFKKRQSESGLYGQGNREWLVRGPFPVTGISTPINHEFIPGEATLAPQAGADGWSSAMYFVNDRVNLKDHFALGTSDQAIAYAFSYFVSPSDQEAELWIGADDPLKVYLNGTAVYTATGSRTFPATAYYSERIKVHIRRGTNTLLIKAEQIYGYFDFSMNICDVEPDILYAGNRVSGLKFSAIGPTGAASDAALSPPNIRLDELYPNPFNSTTAVRYELSTASRVLLNVYDLQGRRVASLVEAERPAGTHMVRWNAKGMASGIYTVRMQTGDGVQARKVVLIR